ncbi:AMP-binding protein [uncultured Maricaulis sp.]|uniref:AMP-binding protein n=1 Tax=uncultured Maricaulis sp. TaxID=174710 RepID=UPI0030DCB249|tara:strand:+ start:143769 stop:145427 length:1659 start_codon:yes stop_codon:yes gene_type:complete
MADTSVAQAATVQTADISANTHYRGADFDLRRIRKSVFAALLQARGRFGSKKIAAIDADGRELSYGDIVKAAFALGHALKQGTQSGEAVGILLPTGVGSIISFYAISAYGRVPAMLNFTAGERALKAACRACKCKRIVTARRFIELGELHELEAMLAVDHEIIYLEDVRENLSLMDKVAAGIGTIFPWAIRAWPSPDAAGVYLFTSGTEGDPKGVVLSHANLLANVEQVRDHVKILPTDKVFNPLPTFHCFGLTGGVLVPLGLGVPTICHPTPLQAKTIVKRIAETGSTILFATDTFINQYARAATNGELSSLRFAVCGAERVKDETRATLRRKFNVEIVEGYGLTEASPVLAVNQPQNNHPGTVGQLMGGCEAKLVHVEGITEGGQLHIRGPNIMKGYIRPSAPLVLEAPADGWHDTGDIVTVDEGGYLRIRGRVKRFAKLGGEMVSLAVVENCATSLWPDCLHAAAALPDKRKGEQIILLTEYAKADRADLIAFARNHGINELSIPRKIIHVESIPVLGTGKTDYGQVQRMVVELVGEPEESAVMPEAVE